MKGFSAIAAVALSALALADARTGGLRPGQGRNLQTQSTNYQEVYFSEMMGAGESVVILEDGPIKFTASCKTVNYDFGFYYSSSSFSNTPSSYSSSMSSSGSSSYTNSTMRSTSASHYYPYSSGSSSTECCGSSYPSSTFSFDFSPSTSYDDDYMGDDDYSFDYSYMYEESFAALELSYTATAADYLYGSPSYSNYPNETVLVGGYEAGESRTQTVFAGRDGGYGDLSTLQSTSGYYVSINGDSTIGIHKEWTEYLPGGTDGFPAGVECMLAGFITYVTPENA